MKKFTIAAVAAFALAAGSASAADLVTKAKPVAAPEPPAWDIAFGSAIASDYIFRGVTQSNHQPSVAAYFEPRYNINKEQQLYAGIGGASISFPNRAAAEIDFYAGYRPTFDKFAFDFGVWYYWYPGGQCFAQTAPLAGATIPNNNFDCSPSGGVAFQALPNGNAIKSNLSFVEIFAKVNYTVNDNITLGGYVYYSPSVLNSGADGVFFGGTAKYTWAALANGVQPYLSGEVGHWSFGTTDSFYGCSPTVGGCLGAFSNGIPLPDYTTWNVGFGWTWKVFTVDLRYIDTDLSKAQCNAFTGDHTAIFNPAGITAINAGNLSNWCSGRFVARLSADLTVNTNLK
ncbi:MAG: hypothetical protein QOF09_3142 [Alphaproteobacteria bacterium]|jgi:uncharacterized protein (TIGR02001 family)|nr:hypothetical protein [Alphaproteobacteria bacterium]